MWGIVHNLIKPGSPEPIEAKCSCGWRGTQPQFAEHVAGIAKDSRDRLTEFVDFVDEEIEDRKWGEIDRFSPDREFLTPAGFVTAMHNLGLSRGSR